MDSVASSGAAWGGSWCEIETVQCEVRAGLPTMILSTGEHPGSTAVLVDLGGPGIPIAQAAEAASSLALPHDVLLVGESWEVDTPSAECLSAEAERVSSFATLERPGCDAGRWSLDPRTYRSAVEQAIAAHGGRLVGAVGVSFGAVRVVVATPDDVPLLLVTPAPPGGSVSALAEARGTAIAQEARSGCGRRADCLASLERINDGPESVRDYELALALIGAAPSPADLRTVARQAGDRERDVRRNAYAATFRYGEGEVLGNLLGYRGQTCSTYGAGSREVGGIASVLAGVLRCAGGSGEVRVSARGRRGCVVLADRDLVTPPALTKPWFERSRLRRVGGGVSRHGVVDGAAARLARGLPESLVDC